MQNRTQSSDIPRIFKGFGHSFFTIISLFKNTIASYLAFFLLGAQLSLLQKHLPRLPLQVLAPCTVLHQHCGVFLPSAPQYCASHMPVAVGFPLQSRLFLKRHCFLTGSALLFCQLYIQPKTLPPINNK